MNPENTLVTNLEVTPEFYAEQLYTVYGEAVGGKAFNGDPLPAWKDFAVDEKKRVQADAWRALGALMALLLQARYQTISLAPGDILLVTVPDKIVGMSQSRLRAVGDVVRKAMGGSGAVRVLVRSESVALEKLADLLTADDLARLAHQLEDRKLKEPVAPVQTNQEKLDIVINGQAAKCIGIASYNDIIVAAGFEAGKILSVTYRHGRTGGILSPGGQVVVEPGMIFNVMDTSNA